MAVRVLVIYSPVIRIHYHGGSTGGRAQLYVIILVIYNIHNVIISGSEY